MSDGLIVVAYIGGAFVGAVEGWAIVQACVLARAHFAQADKHAAKALAIRRAA